MESIYSLSPPYSCPPKLPLRMADSNQAGGSCGKKRTLRELWEASLKEVTPLSVIPHLEHLLGEMWESVIL